jgi:hypothetical protein
VVLLMLTAGLKSPALRVLMAGLKLRPTFNALSTYRPTNLAAAERQGSQEEQRRGADGDVPGRAIAPDDAGRLTRNDEEALRFAAVRPLIEH